MPDPIPPARPATDEEVADFRSQYSDRDVACLELVPAILARLDAALNVVRAAQEWQDAHEVYKSGTPLDTQVRCAYYAAQDELHSAIDAHRRAEEGA
jgi:hypothetical protein